MQLNMHDLTPEQSKQTAKFLHTISDFERLGDHAVNISRVAQELHEKSRIFQMQPNTSFMFLNPH